MDLPNSSALLINAVGQEDDVASAARQAISKERRRLQHSTKVVVIRNCLGRKVCRRVSTTVVMQQQRIVAVAKASPEARRLGMRLLVIEWWQFAVNAAYKKHEEAL